MSSAGSVTSGSAVAATQIGEADALRKLDEAATRLQQDGRYLEALECMEKGLILRHRMYGGRSPQVRLGAARSR